MAQVGKRAGDGRKPRPAFPAFKRSCELPWSFGVYSLSVHSIREDVEELNKLRIRTAPLVWIAQLIDLVGEWWEWEN